LEDGLIDSTSEEAFPQLLAVQIVVPRGFFPGQKMQFQKPDGTQVAVVIPEGVSPGIDKR
jgi:hypothetical protein